MAKSNNQYVLDFVIPAGEEGKMGPMGLMGPTGPTTLEDVIYVQYYNSFNNGLLTIFSTNILPNNSKIFETNDKEILINDPGNYEYTICGKINGNSSIRIQAVDHLGTVSDLTTINSKIESMLFSKTNILQTASEQKIRILFSTNDQNGNADPLKFIIKRLPF